MTISNIWTRGKRFAYVAARKWDQFAIIDGKDYGPYDQILAGGFRASAFSSDSKHVGFWGVRNGKCYRNLDGKEGKPLPYSPGLNDPVPIDYAISDERPWIGWQENKGEFLVQNGNKGPDDDSI